MITPDQATHRGSAAGQRPAKSNGLPSLRSRVRRFESCRGHHRNEALTSRNAGQSLSCTCQNAHGLLTVALFQPRRPSPRRSRPSLSYISPGQQPCVRQPAGGAAGIRDRSDDLGTQQTLLRENARDLLLCRESPLKRKRRRGSLLLGCCVRALTQPTSMPTAVTSTARGPGLA